MTSVASLLLLVSGALLWYQCINHSPADDLRVGARGGKPRRRRTALVSLLVCLAWTGGTSVILGVMTCTTEPSSLKIPELLARAKGAANRASSSRDSI